MEEQPKKMEEPKKIVEKESVPTIVWYRWEFFKKSQSFNLLLIEKKNYKNFATF